MSEFKGTPGPWIAREVRGVGLPGQLGYAIDFNEDQEQVVDYVYEKADAQLIAAAPELLQALMHMIEAYPYSPPDFGWEEQVRAHKRAKEAIAKALGQ